MDDFSKKADSIEKEIYKKISPADKGALERVVLAGQKFMFSEKTHKYMAEILDKPGELADKLALGIVDLMTILMAQSKGQMPPQVILPAVTILLARAGEFIEKTDGSMDTKIFGEALKLAVAGIKSKTEQPQQPQTPREAPAQSAPSGGLINQGA